MIMRNLYKHARKWSLVLLMIFKKCKIISASKLESFNVHQDTSANAVMAETKICTMYDVCSKRSMT